MSWRRMKHDIMKSTYYNIDNISWQHSAFQITISLRYHDDAWCRMKMISWDTILGYADMFTVYNMMNIGYNLYDATMARRLLGDSVWCILRNNNNVNNNNNNNDNM